MWARAACAALMLCGLAEVAFGLPFDGLWRAEPAPEPERCEMLTLGIGSDIPDRAGQQDHRTTAVLSGDHIVSRERVGSDGLFFVIESRVHIGETRGVSFFHLMRRDPAGSQRVPLQTDTHCRPHIAGRCPSLVLNEEINVGVLASFQPADLQRFHVNIRPHFVVVREQHQVIGSAGMFGSVYGGVSGAFGVMQSEAEKNEAREGKSRSDEASPRHKSLRGEIAQSPQRIGIPIPIYLLSVWLTAIPVAAAINWLAGLSIGVWSYLGLMLCVLFAAFLLHCWLAWYVFGSLS